MPLLPKKAFEFSQSEYWDAFFKQRGNKSFEWYGEYPELSVYLHKYMKPKENILAVGCGNSKLSANLYDVGYTNITNIDISKTVIRQMILENQVDRPNLTFQQMDALEMTFDKDSFNVVLDKGTLDALMPDDEPETVKNIEKYFNEIDRVLRIGGRYIVVSLLQKHILHFLLETFMEKAWMVRVCRCYEAESKSFVEQGVKPLPIFMVICTKFKKMPGSKSVLELCPTGDAPCRVPGPDKIIASVTEAQQVAIICARLQKSNSGGREIVLEVGNSEGGSPRYSLHIVDRQQVEKKGGNMQSYAAFIVPQGRESEWAFGTPEGRQYLLSEAKCDRLAVITLNRGHQFENMETVRIELSPIVTDFAPRTVKGKIPFLSVGGDVGVRNEVYVGDSPISGKYVVEETQVDNGVTTRRLYFLSANNVIQSEAKIRKVKTRRGGERVLVDTNSLSCNHHAYMCMGAFAVVEPNSESQVLVIGLGGGSLCSYLRKCLPKSRVTAVELDPEMLHVATNYFGLIEDKQLLVYIKDGLDFISEVSQRGEKYDVVMFDVDNKNAQTGLSCPPPSFMELKTLKTVESILNPKGVFILNLVTRDPALAAEIRERVQSVFTTVGSIKLQDDLNEIIFCFSHETNPSTALSAGSNKFREVINHKKLEQIDCIELSRMMNLMIIDKKKKKD